MIGGFLPHSKKRESHAVRHGRETVGIELVRKGARKKEAFGVYPHYSIFTELQGKKVHVSGKSKRHHEWADLRGILGKMGYTVERKGGHAKDALGNKVDKSYLIVRKGNRQIKGEELIHLLHSIKPLQSPNNEKK